jgi:hypothetical protein
MRAFLILIFALPLHAATYYIDYDGGSALGF